MIAGVYVRVYNAQPQQPLFDAATFLAETLAQAAFLARAYLQARGLWVPALLPRLPAEGATRAGQGGMGGYMPSVAPGMGGRGGGAGAGGVAARQSVKSEGAGPLEQGGEAAAAGGAAASRREAAWSAGDEGRLLACLQAAANVVGGSPGLAVLAAGRATVAALLWAMQAAVAAGVGGCEGNGSVASGGMGHALRDGGAIGTATATASANAGSPFVSSTTNVAAGATSVGGASAVAVTAFDASLCLASLRLMAQLAGHPKGAESLGCEAVVCRLMWLVHRPPTPACRDHCLRVLGALAGRPAVAFCAAEQGGALMLLSAIMPGSEAAYTLGGGGAGVGGSGGAGEGQSAGVTSTAATTAAGARSDAAAAMTREAPTASVTGNDSASEDRLRVAAASLLGRLAQSGAHGSRIVAVLCAVLPAGIVDALRDGPGEAAVGVLEAVSGEQLMCGYIDIICVGLGFGQGL